MSNSPRIGISGWIYGPWRGTFYPEKLPASRHLEYASRQLSSIEINGTFYRLQRPKNFEDWYRQTPEDFIFSVKGGRYITHMKKLGDIEGALANFFASGVLRLEEKLGPILWQLPPIFKFDPQKLQRFFDLLPRDFKEAARVASGHDAWMTSRSSTEFTKNRPIRHCLEVRHPSFETPEFIELLKKHGIALVVADTAGRWPFMEDTTCEFVYVRLHGDEELYVSGYDDDTLSAWAHKIRMWQQGKKAAECKIIQPSIGKKTRRDVYVYFDNDAKVRAPYDAIRLARMLKAFEPADADLPAREERLLGHPRHPQARRKKAA